MSANPFSAQGVYRPLSAARALDLVYRSEKPRPNVAGKWLPAPGFEKGLVFDGQTYWLANEAGTYYFKHPDYEVKA